MAKKTDGIRLQGSLLREVEKLAREDGASVDQFVNVAVAEKVAALRTVRYLEERGARSDIPGAIELLRRLGAGRPAVPGDELDRASDEDEIIRAK